MVERLKKLLHFTKDLFLSYAIVLVYAGGFLVSMAPHVFITAF